MAFCRVPLGTLSLGLFLIVARGQACLGQSSKEVIPLRLEYCVVGAPLIARETLDYEPAQNSSDPTRMHREGKLYRDSEGRARTELQYPDQALTVFLQDCVAGVQYRWRVGDAVAFRWKMRHVGHPYDAATTPKLEDGKDTVMIEGVPTHHSYRSQKETAGKVEQFSEGWYAPSLDLYLMHVFYTAGVGKTTSRTLDLRLTEPDATLFRVPENMTIHDDDAKSPEKSE